MAAALDRLAEIAPVEFETLCHDLIDWYGEGVPLDEEPHLTIYNQACRYLGAALDRAKERQHVRPV